MAHNAIGPVVGSSGASGFSPHPHHERSPFISSRFHRHNDRSSEMAGAAPLAPPSLLLLPLFLFLVLAPISALHLQSHSLSHRRLNSSRLTLYPSSFHSNHRRGLLPERYVLAENVTNLTVGNNRTTTLSSSTDSSAASEHHRHSHKTRIHKWILSFLSGGIAGVVSGAFLSVLFLSLLNCIRGRYRNQRGPSIFSPQHIERAEDLAFLEKDDGLAALEVIGRGGCGEVLKAQLPADPARSETPGMVIAIKRIMKRTAESAEPTSDEESRILDKWMRQIRSEIQTAGHIRHRNLLPLLAHVARPDSYLLIYEYMKNGSLEEALRGVRTGEREMDWPARFKVALGVAAGLEYLHANHRPAIIHRDLKPANILLDDNMEARIADFGLAKEMPEAHTHVTASKVAGTLGYIAPEYGQTMRFTAKCDVYSFGVILAALVVGRMPSDNFFQETEELSLVRWLRNVVGGGNPAAALDPKLTGNGYEEQMLLLLRISVFCTADDPRERPRSKDVRTMLAQIKHCPVQPI